MAHQVILDGSMITGFSKPAESKLEKAGIGYLESVAAECYRLEATRNRGNGPVEVTAEMVDSAADLQRITPIKKSSSTRKRFFKVLASLLPFLTGIFYDSERLKDTQNVIVFVFLAVVTAIIVTISVIQEE